MRKIKVLHSLVRVGSGGVEQRRLSLVRGLDKSLYEQRLICTEAFGGLPEMFTGADCRVDVLGALRHITNVAPYRNALQIIRDWQPDIIHGAVFEGVAIAAVAGRLGSVPIILGEETSDPANRRWKGHLLYRLLTSMTHHMVAVSPVVQNYLLNGIKLPASKVTLINNGVTDSLPISSERKDKIRKTHGIEHGDLIIGSCGRLDDQHKRFSDLIRALAIVRQVCVNAKLLIVGSGPDETMLRALAAQLGVMEHVMFTGYQVDTRPYYEVMDIFALASAREAFGLVLVEAMYARLPVVATHVGGIPGVVLDGETGYLVPPQSPTALASRLLMLANDPSLRQQMGQKGHHRAKNEFGSDRYVQECHDLYQRLVNQMLSR
jgi:glycosyltransferase involved in cell wall biosynthesis